MAEDELDLSELLDEEVEEDGTPEDLEPEIIVAGDAYPDRLLLQHEPTMHGDYLVQDNGMPYIRADAIREGFTKQIWREAVRYARRTAGQPTAALKRARDLIEEGR